MIELTVYVILWFYLHSCDWMLCTGWLNCNLILFIRIHTFYLESQYCKQVWGRLIWIISFCIIPALGDPVRSVRPDGISVPVMGGVQYGFDGIIIQMGQLCYFEYQWVTIVNFAPSNGFIATWCFPFRFWVVLHGPVNLPPGDASQLTLAEAGRWLPGICCHVPGMQHGDAHILAWFVPLSAVQSCGSTMVLPHYKGWCYIYVWHICPVAFSFCINLWCWSSKECPIEHIYSSKGSALSLHSCFKCEEIFGKGGNWW